MEHESIKWLIDVIKQLPADAEVKTDHEGYNNYTTQKDHWLGWLDPELGTGTYSRKSKPGRDAKYVYNHIVEPKMLLWLISAAGIDTELVGAAKAGADAAKSMQWKSAAIRKVVPWGIVEQALLEETNG